MSGYLHTASLGIFSLPFAPDCGTKKTIRSAVSPWLLLCLVTMAGLLTGSNKLLNSKDDMLRITTFYDAQAAVDYFSHALSKEDYFFNEKTVKSHWQGKTASLLGLEGKQVNKEVFSHLMHNIHPKTGKRLTARQSDGRRSAYEFCFNSVKSASLIYAITKDPAILEAHRKGVKTAMMELEADMQTQANRGRYKYYESTSNILFACFEHMTTRPLKTTKEDKTVYIPDPHLHSHVMVPNVCWNEGKKRFQAIEVGNIHRQAPYYEALYHSVFSKQLQKAGYSIQRTGQRWEISGISKDFRDKYSGRTLEIERLAKLKNITDAKEKAQLGARTRVKKNRSAPDEKLQSIWNERLNPTQRQAIKTAKNGNSNGEELITPKEAVDRSMEHFFERKSAMPEKRVLGKAMEYGYGQLTPSQVKAELKTRENVIRANKYGISYMTTKELVQAEERLIEFASSTKGTLPPMNESYSVKQDYLNDQQRSAIGQILSSNDRVSILRGAAGVGKTSLLTEVKWGIEQNGKQVFAVAPSAAATAVLKEKGFTNSNTIAGLLKNEENHEQLRNGVLLVDEAGMIGVQTMGELFNLAKKQNSRLILSGDVRQHSSVEAGDALRLIQKKSALDPATVQKIVRQKNEPYLRAIELLAQGETLKGFQKLDRMGAIKEIEDPDKRRDELASAYLESIKQKRTALIVSPTHAEGRSVSQVVRQMLIEEKIITGPEFLFDTERNLSLTAAEKKDRAQYAEGQVIRFFQNQTGFKAGGKYRVVSTGTPSIRTPSKQTPSKDQATLLVQSTNGDEPVKLPLDVVKNFEVYNPDQTPLAKGDSIRITRNGRTVEGSGIHNGQVYSVKGFSPNGDIQLSNGKTLDKNYGNFQHAIVSTSYGAQGRDAQDVFIAQSADSFAATNQKQFYVSTSRGSERLQIYTDNKESLKEAITRSADRMSAGEVADQHYHRQITRYRTNYHNKLNNRSHEQTQPKRNERHGWHEPEGRLSKPNIGPEKD